MIDFYRKMCAGKKYLLSSISVVLFLVGQHGKLRAEDQMPEVTEVKSTLVINGVDYPESETCGQFNVLFRAIIQNTGTTPIENLETSLDFSDPSQFGAAFIGIVNPPEITFSSAQTTPSVNDDYDGTNDLFLGDGLLYPDDSLIIEFAIEINPEAAGAPSAPIIQLEVTAFGANFDGTPILDPGNGNQQVEFIDLSDDGIDPTTTNPGYPGDTGGEDDPTPLTDCWKDSRNMAANNQVNITLAADCNVLIVPDMIIENHFDACDENFPDGGYYRVRLFTGDQQGVIPNPFDATQYAGQTIVAIVENVTQACSPVWGNILLEDKAGSTGCIKDVVGLYKSGTSYDPLSNENGTCVDGIANLEDHEDLSGNLNTEDSGVNLLICSDVEHIQDVPASWTDVNYTYYTGTPEISDNCSDAKITRVVDQLVDLGCDYLEPLDEIPNRLISQQLIRTFFFEDEFGNEGSVEQTIYFFKPVLQLPNCIVEIDYCNTSEVDEDNTEEDLAPDVINSIPYYIDGAGNQVDLDQHVCNLTASFADITLDGPDNCGFKVIRTWTILEWCWDDALFQNADLLQGYPGCEDNTPTFSDWDNKSLTYEQHLILVDGSAPVVECPVYDADWDGNPDPLVFSVGPFNCEASINVPVPTVDDECSFIWTVSVYTEVPVLWNGLPTGQKTLSKLETLQKFESINEELWETISVQLANVPYGTHYFNYTVTDQCGNVSHINGFDPTGDLDAQIGLLCAFEVIDDIEPIAVCDDNLVLSLGGNGSNYIGGGVGRIYAQDIDEGSWDNCSEVTVQVRRFIREEALELFESLSDLPVSSTKTQLNMPGAAANGQSGYWTAFADYVDFICYDVSDDIVIELGVTDASSNFNSCMMETSVEDKTAPICSAPHDIVINCDEIEFTVNLPEDETTWSNLPESEQAFILNWFEALDTQNNSFAEAADNCNATVQMTNVDFNIHCKSGNIVRYFQATDDNGRTSGTCTQIITINRSHDYCITFPEDVAVSCGNELNIPGIEFDEHGCDLLAVSVQDERFDATSGGEACYKLFRTYRVLNWCQFEDDLDVPGSTDPDFTYFDRYTDIGPMIIGRDEDDDGNPGDEPVTVRFIGTLGNGSASTGTTYIDRNCVFNDNNPSRNGGYWRSTNYAQGFYQYTQVIKVVDQDNPTISGIGADTFDNIANPGTDGDDCLIGVVRTIELAEECSPEEVTIDQVILHPDEALGLGAITLFNNGAITSAAADFNFAIGAANEVVESGARFNLTGDFPIGSHEFEISGSDACGNSGFTFVDFTTKDVKPIAPICLASLSIGLMPVDEDLDGVPEDGMVSVWASDFIASNVVDDCSAPVEYSIHRASEVDAGTDIPAPGQTSITITCADFEVTVVYIYAWDASGNSDRCEALLLTTGFDTICESEIGAGKASIAGRISMINSLALRNVGILLSGYQSDEVVSTEDGVYNFTGIEKGNDYTITPVYDVDHNNGVSTFDIIQITKHILGQQKLDSPYKMIAADVNQSKTITTLDIIQIRKVILSINTRFANNTSWRFMDKNYTFPNPENPWQEPFPEAININNIDGDLTNTDFVAIKIGDVNLDAKGDLETSEVRNITGVFDIYTSATTLKAGKIQEVTFSAKSLDEIEGLQFTLQTQPGVEVLEVQYGLLQEENIGQQYLERGILTASWNRHPDYPLANDVLFTLRLRSNQDMALSTALGIHSKYTAAEAYVLGKSANETLDVALDFNGKTVTASGFVLHQNVPNPFISTTVIGFELPKASKGSLKIYDVNGKLVLTIPGQYEKGYNKIVLERDALKMNGILYYTLETTDFSATRKMIITE